MQSVRKIDICTKDTDSADRCNRCIYQGMVNWKFSNERNAIREKENDDFAWL